MQVFYKYAQWLLDGGLQNDLQTDSLQPPLLFFRGACRQFVWRDGDPEEVCQEGLISNEGGRRCSEAGALVCTVTTATKRYPWPRTVLIMRWLT